MAERQTYDDALERLADSFGFRFNRSLFDIFNTREEIAARKLAELKTFATAQAAARSEEARRALMGDAPALNEGTTGASPTTDPAGAAADLQRELRNEELQRAAADPRLQAYRPMQTLKEAGIDPAAAELARLRGAQADVLEARRDAILEVAGQAEDPLLKADILSGKTTFKGQRVKVKGKDGQWRYYDATPNLAGGYDYQLATDELGDPLTAPELGGGRGGGGDRPTALQKNVAFVARQLWPGDPEAERKATVLLTQLKGKSDEEAWAELVRHVSTMSFGRYSRDKQRLYEKTLELWRVARPGKPSPPPPEEPLAPAAAGTPAPAAPGAPAAPAAPAIAPPPAAPAAAEPTAVNRATGQRLVFRNGRWQPL